MWPIPFIIPFSLWSWGRTLRPSVLDPKRLLFLFFSSCYTLTACQFTSQSSDCSLQMTKSWSDSSLINTRAPVELTLGVPGAARVTSCSIDLRLKRWSGAKCKWRASLFSDSFAWGTLLFVETILLFFTYGDVSTLLCYYRLALLNIILRSRKSYQPGNPTFAIDSSASSYLSGVAWITTILIPTPS